MGTHAPVRLTCGMDRCFLVALHAHWQEELHRYGEVRGTDELRDALRSKHNIGGDNEVMVTAGANQAFMNAVLAVTDPGDSVVLLAPYYFSHLAAVQLAGARGIVTKHDPATWQPHVESLAEILSSAPAKERIRAVVLTTPGNPTGCICDPINMRRVEELCAAAGVWLITDETYQDFVFEGTGHTEPRTDAFEGSPSGVIRIFSMSKALGMPGWRVGYMIYPKDLDESMGKINDCIPTHASIASQKLAHHMLSCSSSSSSSPSGLAVYGRTWVNAQVKNLEACRRWVWDAVHAAGTVKTTGAFYFFVPFPPPFDSAEMEERALEILATDFRVVATPGTAFGVPGHARISYGSLSDGDCKEAAARLRAGLEHLAVAGLRAAAPSEAHKQSE